MRRLGLCVIRMMLGCQNTIILFLLENGKVKCTGINIYGQLGNAINDDEKTPADIPNLTDVTQLAARQYHTCFLLKLVL